MRIGNSEHCRLRQAYGTATFTIVSDEDVARGDGMEASPDSPDASGDGHPATRTARPRWAVPLAIAGAVVVIGGGTAAGITLTGSSGKPPAPARPAAVVKQTSKPKPTSKPTPTATPKKAKPAPTRKPSAVLQTTVPAAVAQPTQAPATTYSAPAATYPAAQPTEAPATPQQDCYAQPDPTCAPPPPPSSLTGGASVASPTTAP